MRHDDVVLGERERERDRQREHQEAAEQVGVAVGRERSGWPRTAAAPLDRVDADVLQQRRRAATSMPEKKSVRASERMREGRSTSCTTRKKTTA